MSSTPPTKPSPIAIIGGGPCGLTFARLLELAGIDYIVFERDASPETDTNPRFQGGTLDLSAEGGQAALRRAGLSEAFEKLARRDATTMTVQDARGNHRVTFGEGNDRPEIDRLQLRRLLLDSLPGDRVRWGKALRSVEVGSHGEEEEGGARRAEDWVLNFADGSREGGFRMVVGTDGAWSRLRELITPAKPEYSGMMYIEGRLSHDNPQYDSAFKMVGAGNSVAIGAGRCLVIQQMSDCSYRIYMGIETPETFTRAGGEADLADMDKARAAVLGVYADFAPHLRAFVEAAEGPWRPWPLYRLPADLFNPERGETKPEGGWGSWKRAPGVVLLGDAAHVTTPNGEGVNQAMYDAVVLFERVSEELGGAGGRTGDGYDKEADAAALERAIKAYEADMRPRAYEGIMDSINMEGLMYSEDGAQNMISMFNHAMEQGGQ